jgi:tRNA(Ile)-lysidine synthase
LAIAHCDHRWRQDSGANATFVEELAQIWQLPYYQATASCPPASEALAREWRYAQLAEIAQQNQYTHIATGHTASDRAETLLFNLIRGSGTDGLQALAWHRPLPTADSGSGKLQLVRPLLGITRAATAEFCGQRSLKIWEDSTNQDMTYRRNWIRLELLPILKQHLNPQVEETLAQTAELLQAEVDLLETEATHLREQAISKDSPEIRPGFNRQILQQAPLPLQRRVARQILQQLLKHAPTFDHIEKLVALIPAPNRSQTDPFPGGAIAYVENEWIWFKKL